MIIPLIKSSKININQLLTFQLKYVRMGYSIWVWFIHIILALVNLNELLKKFLSFLIHKRRFFYVDKILREFIETCSKKRGEIKAELISAKDLSESDVENIKKDLSNSFNSKIKLTYKNDKSLVGGLILQVGSTMIDTSIKNKLQKIEKQMVEA